MICAIHQPQYLPWLGYFDKMDKADVFVFYDDTQFKKNEWQNRNKIKTAQGWQWLTVPVLHDFGQEIRQVQVNSNVDWARKHLNALISNYSRAAHFAAHREFLEDAFARKWTHLVDVNLHFIQYVMEQLGIQKRTLRSSELGVTGVATEALIGICKRVGADTYLSGVGGRDYLDERRFAEEHIGLVYQEFNHPIYPQRYGEFVSHLSIVDLLFNCGGESLARMRGTAQKGA